MIFCPHCQAVNDDRKTRCVNCGESLLDDPALPGDPYVGRQFGRRFTLEHIVGSGEIGMVYRGTDGKTGQPVAVKIVHTDVAQVHGDELLRWARRVAQIRHAKVATVLGASREADGTTYMVSEFVEGETLRALIERTGPLSARRSADILFQLCNALAPIHKVGRPHANLKPENVFLVAGQQKDFVKITDTGSPVLFGVHRTDRGQVVIGAPKYFSPEQARGDEAVLASDQFTVGVIGYQLLSGALPFFGATPDQLLDAVRSGRPTPITERAPATPPELAAVIERCMEKDPASRFPDLRALAREIARVIKSRPKAPVRKRPSFGAGLDMSTVIARPDELPDLDQYTPLGSAGGFTSADAEATVMQELPEDIQALLDDAASPVRAEPQPEADDDFDLDFDDDFGDDLDLNAALADAAASVEPAPLMPPLPSVPANRPTPPALHNRPVSSAPVPQAGIRKRPTPARGSAALGPEGDLAALMAEAEAELDAQAGGPAPVFNPFGGDVEPAEPRRPTPSRGGAPIAARASVSQPLRPDDILSAIGETLEPPGASVRQKPDSDAASPLATAADFTRLSVPPRDAATLNRTPSSISGPVVSAGGRASGSQLGLVLILLLLLGGGGAAVWFLVLAPEAGTDPPKPTPQRPVTKEKAAPEPKEKPAPAPAPEARTIELVTDPAGAAVFDGEEKLGETPLKLPVGEAKRALLFKVEGRPDTPFELDPAVLDAPEGEGPAQITVPLAEPAAEPKGATKPKDVAKPPPKRRRTRRKPPNPDNIRDPFANP